MVSIWASGISPPQFNARSTSLRSTGKRSFVGPDSGAAARIGAVRTVCPVAGKVANLTFAQLAGTDTDRVAAFGKLALSLRRPSGCRYQGATDRQATAWALSTMSFEGEATILARS
jgi:hypothetical protein